MKERLQKLMSAVGLTSRREAEGWITAGRVTVNGRVATLGDKADPAQDSILVDGIPLTLVETPTYVMLHKPRGIVTTLSDEKKRKTVADLVADCGIRLGPVGRLDVPSEGLLIMTNDGALTHKLLHPSHQVEKEYLIWVTGDPLALATASESLAQPMFLDGQEVQAVSVVQRWVSKEQGHFSVTIRQGKNRQIRRMCQQIDLSVTRLKRIREGALLLDQTLPPGKWRTLTKGEVSLLFPTS